MRLIHPREFAAYAAYRQQGMCGFAINCFLPDSSMERNVKLDPTRILLAFVLCWFYAASAIASDSDASKEQIEVPSEPPSPAAVSEMSNEETAEISSEQTEATGESQSPAAESEMASEATTEKSPEPVTGAFGIPLGKRFEPCMVARVISQEEHNYQGLDKAKYQGTLYRVEPTNS